jgi:hypothetical protein
MTNSVPTGCWRWRIPKANPGLRVLATIFLFTTTNVFAADVGGWAFVHPEDTFKANALLDLRSLNESVAGQGGFVHLSPGGEFLRGDGAPIRFWCCGTGQYTESDAALASHARFLAKLGVNMVRLHAQIASIGDAPALTDVNMKEIDGIWRAVAAFKKQGIYLTISPYWANGKSARRWGIDGYENESDLWGLLFFNETLQRGYKAWVRKLYDTSNPYTGIPLSKDSAVAIIQVQNEDGMFFWTMQGLKPPQKALLGRKFAHWVIAKYGSLERGADAWDGFEDRGDSLASSQLGIMNIWEWTQPQTDGKARRLADQLQFFADTQRRFYADMESYFHHDLGCGQLINASNWITADGPRLNDVERYTDTACDVLAVNRYFTGIHQGKYNGWRIDPGDFFTDNPAVLNPRDLPINLKQVVGHPMLVTESSWVNPLDFQSEGPFLIAAYQSLSGVGGYYWFTATAPQYDMDPYFDFLNIGGQHPFRKWTCSTPAIMGNFPAAALLYRKGYLKQGEPVIVERRTLNDLWSRRLPVIAEDKGYDPNRMAGDRGQRAGPAQGADPLAFLVGPVKVAYDGSGPSQISDLSSYIDHRAKTIKSNTGQIEMNYDIGLCTIDAPAAQGATGFLAKAGAVKLGTVEIQSTDEHATVVVVAMDDRPIRESRKLLVQIGAAVRPSGWEQASAQSESEDKKTTYTGFRIRNTGKPPYWISNSNITLEIQNPDLKTAAVLDTAGYAVNQLTLLNQNGRVKIHLPPDAMYVILQ